MSMTREQEDQRDRTYKMAEELKAQGVECQVVDWFCTNPNEDASGIVLKKRDEL